MFINFDTKLFNNSKLDTNNLKNSSNLNDFKNRTLLKCNLQNKYSLQSAEICTESESMCYTLWKVNGTSFKIIMKGCWETIDDKSKTDCSQGTKDTFWICLCDYDYCNNDLIPNLKLTNDNKALSIVNNEITPKSIFIFNILLSLVAAILFICLICSYYIFRNSKISKKLEKVNDIENLEVQDPLLTKDEIQIKLLLYEGRFGNLYLANLIHESPFEQDKLADGQFNFKQNVVVKTFLDKDKENFKNEYNIYTLPHLKNENIAKFIGAEKRLNNLNQTEYWIITEYHELGSLCHYLKNHLVTYQQLLRICYDIAQGLAHLHGHNNTNIENRRVIHRDLKSENIILKYDLTACICDFEMSLVVESDKLINIDLGQVGTVRYMAPEILDGAVHFTCEALLKTDIYSCSLIFWEVLCRCLDIQTRGEENVYKLAYEEELGKDITIEEMREYVSENKKRPKIPKHWHLNNYISLFCDTVNDCWDQDCEARLSAASILERLNALIKE